jgi:hypothetical protein
MGCGLKRIGASKTIGPSAPASRVRLRRLRNVFADHMTAAPERQAAMRTGSNILVERSLCGYCVTGLCQHKDRAGSGPFFHLEGALFIVWLWHERNDTTTPALCRVGNDAARCRYIPTGIPMRLIGVTAFAGLIATTAHAAGRCYSAIKDGTYTTSKTASAQC